MANFGDLQSYYAPNKSKDNLNLLTGAEATRILFDRDEAGELVATGVEYSKDGELKIISAKKEVIVSTGMFLDVLSSTRLTITGRFLQNTPTS